MWHLGPTQKTQDYLISKPLTTYELPYELTSNLTFTGSRDLDLISLGAPYQRSDPMLYVPFSAIQRGIAGQRVYVIFALAS